jgi:catechol 2,3-dioxygenase-like lactoylglutathione lyase family enzyme
LNELAAPEKPAGFKTIHTSVHPVFNFMNQKLCRLSTYLFVADIDQSLGFYALLGMDVEKVSPAFGRASVGTEVVLELGTGELTASYDPGYVEPAGGSKGTINFELESRTAVDEKFTQLVVAGYTGHLKPIDALWQARFAVVLDPDGNQVGLHSPRNVDEDRQ